QANRAKWEEVLSHIHAQELDLHLFIDSWDFEAPVAKEDDPVLNLPYGLLYDREKGDPLFRRPAGRRTRAIRFLRFLRQSAPKSLELQRRPLRILAAVAEPDDPKLKVGCAALFAQLARVWSEARGPDNELAFEVMVCARDGVKPLAD